MMEGTKKLFPKDYEQFKEAMISAANDNSLPVSLQLDDIRDYTLKDLQDIALQSSLFGLRRIYLFGFLWYDMG